MPKEAYWSLALSRSRDAISNGALIPLATELITFGTELFKDFEVRELKGETPSSLNSYGPKLNPFSPVDTRLLLDYIKGTHILLLNKYPVQIGHMLLVTRNWKAQNGWLTIEDWAAVNYVEKDTTGLWFFNSSPIAGASQPHRHIQLLRRSSSEKRCPRLRWFESSLESRIKNTKYMSIIKRTKTESNHLGEDLYKDYLTLTKQIGMGSPDKDEKPLFAYNLIVVNDWIAIVKRAKDSYAGFNVNGLGFAGYILCTNKSDLQWLRSNSPEKLLMNVVETN